MPNSAKKLKIDVDNDESFKKIPNYKKDSWFDDVSLIEGEILCPTCEEMIATRLSAITHFKMHLKPFCCICFCQMETQAELVRLFLPYYQY